MLKEIPIYERPREKALKYGISTLSNAELLAIILRTGSKENNVISLAHKILNEISCLNDLKEMSIQELLNLPGIGQTKAITILACVELGYRMLVEQKKELSFTSAKEVFNFMKPRFQGLKEETLYVIYLNAKNIVIDIKQLTKGNINSTIIDGKLIFKWAYKLAAVAMILVHNHPSGDSSPSIQDLKYTEMIIKQANIAGFIIVDHIVIGNDFYSMKRNEKMFKMF